MGGFDPRSRAAVLAAFVLVLLEACGKSSGDDPIPGVSGSAGDGSSGMAGTPNEGGAGNDGGRGGTTSGTSAEGGASGRTNGSAGAFGGSNTAGEASSGLGGTGGSSTSGGGGGLVGSDAGQGGEPSGEGGSGGSATGGSGAVGSGGADQSAAIGLQVVLQNPSAADNPDGRRCQVQPNGARSYQIGQPNGDGTVENGSNGVELSCAVQADGQISITLSGQNQAVGLPGVFSMNLTGSVESATDGAQNLATLEFFDASAGTMTSDPGAPCTLSPPAASSAITLQAGALLASFTCPLIVSLDAPGDGCRATGTIAVEYCETSVD